MSNIDKWQFYVQKLGKAEEKLRSAIIDWRNFKKAITKKKYENYVSDRNYDLFQWTPNEMLDKINVAKVKVEFCKIKIEFYREMELNGKNQSNEEKLNRLNSKAANYMSKYDYLGDL